MAMAFDGCSRARYITNEVDENSLEDRQSLLWEG